VGSLQLIIKTRGLGDQLVSRLAFRNFYTQLAWGRSDFISAVMEVVLCACVVLFLLDRRPLARAVVIAGGLLAGRSFLVLLSRGGLVGLLAFTLVLVFGLGGWRAPLAAAIAVVGGGLGLLTPGGQALLGRFTDPNEAGSIFMRFVLWSTSWTRFLSSPWTGVGLNQARYQHDLIGADWGANLVLDTLAELGILGGVLIIALLVAAFRMARRSEPGGPLDARRPVRVALIGLLLEFVIHASIEPTLTGPAMMVPLVYLFAWLTLKDPHGDPRATAPRSRLTAARAPLKAPDF